MVAHLKIGLIGCGEISRAHRQAMKGHEDAAFVSFCDQDESKAQQAAAEDSGTAYRDVGQMLDEQQLDGIVICTPPVARTELIEAAASRKLAVLCEKPPAANLDMARRTQEIVDRYDPLVSIAFLFRYFPVVDRLRELIADRAVAYVRSRYLGDVANNDHFQQAKPWYTLKDQSGGPILDQAIHVLDVIRFLFGDTDEVIAQGAFRTRESSEINTAEDTVTLQFVTNTGVLVSHCHCWGHHRWLDEMEVTGADFSFLVDLNHQRLTGVNRDEQVHIEQAVNGYAVEQRAWLDAIRTGDRSLIRATHADAIKSLDLCLAACRSVDSGQRERLAECLAADRT